MRGILASSIGVTCAAALALPLAPPATAADARPAPTAEAATRAAVTARPDIPGSTQSLPLRPLTRDRASGAAVLGLAPRAVRPFSLLGVVWDDPAAELHGRVQVRTREAGTGAWSGWRDVETHYADHGADPGSAEGTADGVRGATAPLWVGESDGVEIRVLPEPGEDEGEGTGVDEPGAGDHSVLPSGLRLELVDPGDEALEGPRTGLMSAEATAASAANSALAPLGALEIPALNSEQTRQEYLTLRGADLTEQQRAKPYIGPRPAIVTRRGWGANESLREKRFVYTGKVKAAFVHHTASGNNYKCSQAPSLIRGFYRYHVRSLGWRDIGYNFLVDKCGRIYEGRAGGVAKPVKGAHTLGFNTDTTGIAVIGSYGSKKPSSSAVKAIARLTAWKLGLHGMNPRAKTYLKSGGGNLYRKGKKVRLNVISGHRDGFNTSCPGGKLYKKLGTARSTAARYQGR
ncbi:MULTISPECIES: peptidoglycan recognition protein family protein [unclassified Streptomyces]|uniref:peptidoglycan recognition protein family protein n=1 Tax=unclassified Streptomyces TaxID=2593676 RepID=UPI000938EED9|nr:peptidoglycan recognition protein [Streptomyces sp. CB02400]OKJ99321.1 N-acetylmuramoyl-L-alanine amidase [Streptomyces sp. CB02400]